MSVKDVLGTADLRRRADELEARVHELEEEVTRLRRHHIRLAEITDVVQELLVPVALRDEEAIARAVETFNRSL